MSGRGARRLGTALVASALAGCASRPAITYRGGPELTETGDVKSQSWRHLAEIGVQDTVGPDFEYRLSQRILHTDTNIEAQQLDTRFVSTLSETAIDTAMTIGTLAWIQGLQLNLERSTLEGAADNDLVRSNILQKLEWTPFGLPQVTGWVNFRDTEDDLFIDRRRRDSVFQIEEERGAISYLYAYRDQNINDVSDGVDRDDVDQILRATYDDEYFGGKLTTTLGVFANERRETVQAPTGSTVALQVPRVAGLSVIDPTPQIAVLADTPALIDGDDTTSTGINIGGFASGGEVDWNIGVEVPLGSVLDQLRLFTVDPVGPNFADQFSFSVWVSDDNSFWTQVTGAANFTYEQPFRRFVITIPSVSQRFVKIVNSASPATAPAVLVTELETLITTGELSSSRADRSTRNATGNFGWWALDNLRLTYDLFVQTDEQDRDGVPTRDQTRVNNGLAAFWDITGNLDMAARFESQRSDDPVNVDEDRTIVSDRLTYRPLDTLELTLNYTQTERDVDGADDVDTRAAQVAASAQLLDNLVADLSVEQNDTKDATNMFDVDRFIVAASLDAELSRFVGVTLGARVVDALVSGSGAALVPDPSEERYELRFVYQPSAQLTTEVRLDYLDNFAGAGLDQGLRLDWLPFPDGTIDLQLDADRIIRGLTGETTDRYQARARWNLNPRTFLQVNYASLVPETTDRTNIVTATFNFIL